MQKHIFLHCNANNLLKILQTWQNMGDNHPAPNSEGGDLSPRPLVIYAHDCMDYRSGISAGRSLPVP